MPYLHSETTGIIIHRAYRLYNAIGSGFREKVYQRGLAVELLDAGLEVRAEVPIPLIHKHVDIGDYFADLVVNDTVIVELKAIDALARWHPAQLINYLRVSGKEVGLLINFGPERVEIKRRVHTDDPGAEMQAS